MKIKNLSLVIVLMAAAAAFSNTSAQSVSGSIAGGAVTRGKAARATVVLSIPGGLHVNSNRPNSEYAVATVVRASAPGVKIGPVSYPRGKNRKFSFSENTINVYEGRTSFGFNITVPTTFRGNRVSVRVAVKYQACTDEVCYPPKTKEVTLTARVN
jgi:thiol:disulfide interchange protein